MTALVLGLAASAADPKSGERLVVMGALLALVVLGWLAMWRGWRRRAARQADLPALPQPPAGADEHLLAAPVEVVYLGTTTSGDWLDRVVAQGLGARSDGTVAVSADGLLVTHGRHRDALWIPVGAIEAWRWTSKLAGKVVRGGSVLLVTWQHGGRRLDTGVFARRSAQRAALQDAVSQLVPAGSAS